MEMFENYPKSSARFNLIQRFLSSRTIFVDAHYKANNTEILYHVCIYNLMRDTTFRTSFSHFKQHDSRLPWSLYGHMDSIRICSMNIKTHKLQLERSIDTCSHVRTLFIIYNAHS